MAGSSFSLCLREFFQDPSHMLCVRSFGTVLCSPFGLIVHDTGLSTFGRTCTAFDCAEEEDLNFDCEPEEWTGQPTLVFLTGPIIIWCAFSCTTMLSIILTILAICCDGVTVTWDICAMGAIMKGSLRISLKTVLKKVILQTGGLS